jgi:hypothetical protein
MGTVDLSAGDHVVRTGDASTSGFAVDQLVLGSDRGGAALPLGPRGQVPPAEEPVTPPEVVVEDQDGDHLRLRIDGATERFELVLGQSLSDGWRATAEGATLTSPAPRLVDGYANGWSLSPTGDGSITVTLSWGPQRMVWPAIALSALALVGCLVLALLPRRRPATPGDDDEEPTAVLRRPRLDDFASLPARSRWVVAGLTAGASLLVMTWWAAPLAGVLVLVALSFRPLRLILLAGPLLLGVAGAGVVAGQVLFEPLPGYGWPGLFDPLDTLVWLAVVLVLVEIGLTAWLRRPPGRASPGGGLKGAPGGPSLTSPCSTDPEPA